MRVHFKPKHRQQMCLGRLTVFMTSLPLIIKPASIWRSELIYKEAASVISEEPDCASNNVVLYVIGETAATETVF